MDASMACCKCTSSWFAGVMSSVQRSMTPDMRACSRFPPRSRERWAGDRGEAEVVGNAGYTDHATCVCFRSGYHTMMHTVYDTMTDGWILLAVSNKRIRTCVAIMSCLSLISLSLSLLLLSVRCEIACKSFVPCPRVHDSVKRPCDQRRGVCASAQRNRKRRHALFFNTRESTHRQRRTIAACTQS